VVFGRPRLTELVAPIGGAGDPDREAKNTLSFYLTLSTFSSPVTETPLDYKREGHLPRKDHHLQKT
jgi:hypothetical protein